jgi:hypothetical protein
MTLRNKPTSDKLSQLSSFTSTKPSKILLGWSATSPNYPKNISLCCLLTITVTESRASKCAPESISTSSTWSCKSMWASLSKSVYQMVQLWWGPRISSREMWSKCAPLLSRLCVSGPPKAPKNAWVAINQSSMRSQATLLSRVGQLLTQ